MSEIGALSERLRQRAEQSRQQAESLIQSELEQLSSSCRKHARSVLSTIASDMERQSKAMSQSMSELESRVRTLQKRLTLAVVGLLSLLVLGLSGTWGLTQFLSQQVKAELVELEKAKRTKQQLQVWGLEPFEANGEKYIALPEGMKASAGWTLKGGRTAVKLEE